MPKGGPLSEKTMKVYNQVLEAVRKELGVAVNFEEDTEMVWNVIRRARGGDASQATIRTRLSAIMNYLREEGEDADFYRKKLDESWEVDKDKRTDPKTYEAKETDLKWKDVANIHTKLKDEDQLIIALYTLAKAPRRLEYRNMLVVNNMKHTHNKDRNYLLWNSVPRFVFNNYKTSGKYGRQVVRVPLPLQRIIAPHIRMGEPLLAKLQHEEYTDAQFSDKIRRIMKSELGEKYSVNDFRHAFITQFLSRNPTTDARMRIASLMGNSMGEQLTYDRRHKTDDSGDVSD
jgi:hypothetical protein